MSRHFSDAGSSLAVMKAMATDIWAALEKYQDSMPVASAIGVLEAIKMEIIMSGMQAMEEDDDDFDD